jgi:metal-responsive CopG/Arc/MetJ family transcriptional regulator
MSNEDYTTIKIPNEIVERIEKIVKTNKFGFKSRSEFIKEAIRQELKYYETTNHQERHQ